MLLLLNLTIIFSTIFAIIKYDNKANLIDWNLADLIKSIAMYTRTTGHLPHSQQNTIPWEDIGISASFFNTNLQSSKTIYAPAITLLDQSLTPIDFKLVETSYANSLKDKKFASTCLRIDSIENKTLNEMKRKSIAYMPLNSVAFEIATPNSLISINIKTLAYMANYPIELAKLDENIIGMPIYLKDSFEWNQLFYLYY